jgi:adenosylcobinamide-GDP ribazoletransferase
VTASVRAAVAAVSFLTVVPLGRRVEVGAADVARGAVLFPVVGVGIGVLAGLAAAGLEGPLPGLVAGAIGVAVAVALSGGLHVDALADTADALGAERARALEIMRDPRIGAFGAAAVALTLLVEAGSLGALAEQGDAAAAFLVAGALSRATAPLLARAVPYAREAGTGAVLSGGLAAAAPVAGAVLAVGAAVGFFGWDGIAVAAGVGAFAAACGFLSGRWLGGVTGDTLGATIQLSEVAVLAGLLALR